jgi:hypothetical protein
MLELYGPNMDAVVVGDGLSHHTNVGEGSVHTVDPLTGKPQRPMVAHTNHFLSQNPLVRVCGGNDGELWPLQGSRERLTRVNHIISSTVGSGMDVVKGILGDHVTSEHEEQARVGGHRCTEPVEQPFRAVFPGQAPEWNTVMPDHDGDSSGSSSSEEQSEEEEESAGGEGGPLEKKEDLTGNSNGTAARDVSHCLYAGTLCSIVMDLKGREFHITRGNPKDHRFERIPISDSAGYA